MHQKENINIISDLSFYLKDHILCTLFTRYFVHFVRLENLYQSLESMLFRFTFYTHTEFHFMIHHKLFNQFAV